MPRYSVKHNGMWACFSTIVDAFITPFMAKESYEQWRLEEYGKAGYKPAECSNMMTIGEAVSSTSLNRTYKETCACLVETGLSVDEVVKLYSEYAE